MQSQKGQIEIETILAIFFSLSMLIMAIVFTQQQEQEIKTIESLDKEKTECNNISSFISLMSASESTDSIVIESEFGATISGDTVIIGNHYCTFSGDTADTVVGSGKIKLYESGGVVVVENA